MRRVTPLLGTLAVVTMLAAGCAGATTTSARDLKTKPAGPTKSGGPVVVPASLKFTGKTLDGRPFDAATLAGKPVILWFWAPWCATCMGQAPEVHDIGSQYAGRVSVLGIAGLDQSVPAMKQFVTDGDVANVPHLDDKAGVLYRRFNITEQSTFVLINRKGKVMATTYLDTVTLGDWAAYLDKH
jgi:thiol-disulfide isomerase/thioredoxin